jgi:transcriptional regulator with XRE-family HTH domain
VTFSSLSCARLQDERKRLGFSQADAAAQCGVSREVWGRYERGAAVPGGEVLYAFAHLGADIQFILTGIRSSGELSDDESELVARFRKAPLAVKASTLAGLAAGAEPQPKGAKKQVFRASVGQVVEGSITNEAGVSFNFGVNKTKE